MALNPDRANAPDKQPEIEGAFFVHAALQRFASEVPEAANNIYFQQAMQEAAAGYQTAMAK